MTRAGSKVRILASALVVSAVVGGGACLAGGSGAGASSYPPIPAGPIKVGMTLDLSGTYAADGVATSHTANAILAKYDQYFGGTIDGHKVEYDIINDGSDPTQAVTAAEQLANDHVAAVVNTSFNPAAYDLEIPVLNHAKILMLSDVSEEQFQNAKAYPYFFSVSTSVPAAGKLMGEFFRSRHLDKVAVLTDGIETDTQYVDAMKASLGSGQSVVDTVTIPPGSVEVTTALQQLRQSAPDVLVVAVSIGFGPIWQELQTIGWTPTIMTNENVFFDGYTAIGSLAPKMYSTCATGIAEGVTLPAKPTSTLEAIEALSGGQIPDLQDAVQESMDELLILRKVITEDNTLDSAALAKSIEGLHDDSFFWSGWKYHFSTSDHFGYSSGSICQVSPLGTDLIPVSVYH